MLKTLLISLFTGLACFSTMAQNASSIAILPREHTAEIQSKDVDGYTESPEVLITNSTNHCVANAADFGVTDKVAVTTFVNSRDHLYVIQVFRAVFNNCPLYFGRVKNLSIKETEPQFVLLGVSTRSSDIEIGVSYEGLTLHEQVERLVAELQVLANSQRENPARSLVLNTF